MEETKLIKILHEKERRFEVGSKEWEVAVGNWQ